jgi:hypothetical protein
MDYQYENLGPERFQELCQALLINEIPNIQCFPVGQPDGGRDAISFHLSGKGKFNFNIYQVKFVRKPLSEKEPHSWLIKTMEMEIPKIRNMIPKGAKAYYLITNIPGTGHFDTGSIDKIISLVEKGLDLPFYCWWRDDLNRKMDNAWNLKWVYPEIITGPDLLRYIVEEGLSEDKSRRTSAIKAFIRSQYDKEKDVRFKQVDLQNNLFDLFVDAPLKVRDVKEEGLIKFIFNNIKSDPVNNGDFCGTASLLVHPIAQKYIPKLVLEGAPGQGKSTLSQFICQVHRMRVLGMDNILNELITQKKVQSQQKPSAVRIPFKIELKDLSTWLSGRDPFSPEDYVVLPDQWEKSLESFLAALIRHGSGGINFTVSDLYSVIRVSSILIVLDGLDEVADIKKRQELIDLVVLGINRLSDNAASLQVIITSRPVAFANSPGFPEKDFPHFQLDSLNSELIDKYANKWLDAKRIYGPTATEVRSILKEKLTQPHLRDLARNPMQLSILLNLIYTRGSSLPDKRTALYDNYVDLFFAREAEKNTIVRKHRDLLIDIHRYIAWILHLEAEENNQKGSISTERLDLLLTEYLKAEEHNSSLVKALFTSVVERVVFLVSRVEGTYEFEVQPLREYFAARHLYETSPYSPPGNERKGTKPDRFDVIARNFYWLNVTRFFAGCFSKGELPTLVDLLSELAKEDKFKYTSHPRLLAAMLLSDWVFAQHPKSMKEAIKLVLDGIGLRHILSSSSSSSSRKRGVDLILPSGCGREQLVEECFSILKHNLAPDFAMEIIGLLEANSNRSERKELWEKELKEIEISQLTTWLRYGLYMGTLSELSNEDLAKIVDYNYEVPTTLNLIFSAGHNRFIESSEVRCKIIIDNILAGETKVPINRRDTSIIIRFAQITNPALYASSFDNPRPIQLLTNWKHSILFLDNTSINFGELEEPSNEPLATCSKVINIFESEALRSTSEWATDLLPWESIVEILRNSFGDTWLSFRLANIAAFIKSTQERCTDFSDLFDIGTSLCRRVRYCRFASNNWWLKQFGATKTRTDLMFITLVFLTCASKNKLIELIQIIYPRFNEFTDCEWEKIYWTANEALFLTQQNRKRATISNLSISGFSQELSDRAVVAIGLRANAKEIVSLHSKYLKNYDGKDKTVLSFCERVSQLILRNDSSNWEHALNVIQKNYESGNYDDRHYYRYGRPFSLPLPAAKVIAESPEKYPRYLVVTAERIFRNEAASKIIPVGKLARQEKWFEND